MSGSDNTSVTKGQGTRKKERKREGEGLTRRGMKSRIIGQIERPSLSTGCQRVFTSRYFLFMYYLHLGPSIHRRPSIHVLLKQGFFDLLDTLLYMIFPFNPLSLDFPTCDSQNCKRDRVIFMGMLFVVDFNAIEC